MAPQTFNIPASAGYSKTACEAADKFNDAATKVAADKRANIDAAVKQMKAEAAEAEVRLQKLKQAGSESWAALSGALAETRAAFDRADDAARKAFKRAAGSAE